MVEQKGIFDLPPPSRVLHPSRILVEPFSNSDKFLFHVRKRCEHDDCWRMPDVEAECSGPSMESFCRRAIASPHRPYQADGRMHIGRTVHLSAAHDTAVESYFWWINNMKRYLYRMYVGDPKKRDRMVRQSLLARFAGDSWDEELTLTLADGFACGLCFVSLLQEGTIELPGGG